MRNWIFNKSLFMFLSVAALLFLYSCKSSNPVDSNNNQNITFTDNQKLIINSSGSFGINLFKLASQNDNSSNVILAPLSVSTAFGMALNGSAGNTLTQMESTLGVTGLQMSDINQSEKDLLTTLSSVDNKVIFSYANSIWYDNNFPVESSFINVNKTYFNSLVKPVNFNNPLTVDTINSWVNTSTNGKIDKIIDDIPSGMVMYLINAIYFNAPWQYKFDKSLTSNGNFYLTNNNTLSVPFMTQENKYGFYKSANYSAARLPYSNGAYSMIIVLPLEGNNIQDIINNFSSQEFNNILNGFTERTLTVTIPKFTLQYGKKLNDYLITLGMTDAFSPLNANFTNINKDIQIYISEVMHKTYVAINEDGVEAAGVTSIGIRATAVSQDDYFTVNKPFMFIIYEQNSGTIMFIGRVNNPASTQ